MKRPSFSLGLCAAMLLLPCVARAQTTYLNETFEDDTIGSVPADPAQRNPLSTNTTGFVTVAAGTGAIGTSHVVNFNDNSTTAGADLEYNVGAAALGALYVQFDLLNNAPNATGTAANPLIFGVGAYNNTSGSALLGANANRAFNIEFYQTGASSTLRLRYANGTSSTMAYNTTYNLSQLANVKVFVNDNDTNTLLYTRPDGVGATLNANSFVVFLNNTLLSVETDAGLPMNMVSGLSGDTTGNATIGRFGFNTSSTNTANFLLDNIFASDIPAVPEPTTILGAVALVGVAGFRERKRGQRMAQAWLRRGGH